MNKKERYSEENMRRVVSISSTIGESLRNLGIRSAGGNYKIFHKYVKLYGIDTSHFNSKEKRISGMVKYAKKKKKLLEEILTINSNYSRGHLKERLYNEGIKERKCELCGQCEEWRGEKMSLILDHINGVYNDNRIENLQIVCPNCNATLPTHCNKKRDNEDR